MPQDNRTRLLLWDEADVASRLRDVLVAQLPSTPEPDVDALFDWLEGRCAAGEEPEAVYFTAVATGEEEARAAGITKLREQGYEVHVRPAGRDSSATSAILARAQAAVAEGGVREVIVASHDEAGLASGLEALPQDVTVTVLGFRERASFAVSSGRLGFVDLEELAGVLPSPLPRTNLYDLPDEGRALAPLRRRGRSSASHTEAPAVEPTSATPAWATPTTASPQAEAPAPPSVPAEPAPAPAPASEPVGSALDDLLAGIRPAPVSPAAPPPARPGRVAPPNGTP